MFSDILLVISYISIVAGYPMLFHGIGAMHFSWEADRLSTAILGTILIFVGFRYNDDLLFLLCLPLAMILVLFCLGIAKPAPKR